MSQPFFLSLARTEYAIRMMKKSQTKRKNEKNSLELPLWFTSICVLWTHKQIKGEPSIYLDIWLNSTRKFIANIRKAFFPHSYSILFHCSLPFFFIRYLCHYLSESYRYMQSAHTIVLSAWIMDKSLNEWFTS